MNFTTQNPSEVAENSLDITSDQAKTIAEEAGIDFEIIKPLLTSKFPPNTPIDSEWQQQVENGSEITQLGSASLKSPFKTTSFEPSNILPQSLHKPENDSAQRVNNKLDASYNSIQSSTKGGEDGDIDPANQMRPAKIDCPEGPLKMRQMNQERLSNNKLPSFYNLRRPARAHSLLLRGDAIWINKKSKPDCIRQKALTSIVFEKYHQNSMPDDEFAEKLLDSSKISQLSQIDRFCYDGREFIVITWLNAVRIFEFDPRHSKYFEIRRMPHRYIAFNSNLITSVHYSDSKLYIAYMSGEDTIIKGCDMSNQVAYVELRDLHGRLLEDPFCYSQIIKSIQSNKNFIYVKTIRHTIYIHKKSHFNFNPYYIDMSLMTLDPIVFLSAHPIVSNLNQLRLLTATPNHILLTKLDGLQHTVWQSYNFGCAEDLSYKTISMKIRDKQVIIHRDRIGPDGCAETNSKLEFGSLRRVTPRKLKGDEYFIHERSLTFKYHILQIELSLDCETLFLYGRTKTSDEQLVYELGRLQLDSLKPLWCTRLSKSNEESKFLVHKDHLVIIQDCQRHFTISTNSSKQIKCQDCHIIHPDLHQNGHDQHPGLFRDINLKVNAQVCDQRTIQSLTGNS